jgi:hypothetical protein
MRDGEVLLCDVVRSPAGVAHRKPFPAKGMRRAQLTKGPIDAQEARCVCESWRGTSIARGMAPRESRPPSQTLEDVPPSDCEGPREQGTPRELWHTSWRGQMGVDV